ncbi:MAG: copper chaperone PCu(A)C [Nevskiaceae bacterium]
MKTLLAAALALLAGAPAAACPGPAVEEAWIREAPPGAMSVAYAKLANRGKQPLVLDGARSEAFGGAGLHRTVLDAGGMSRMREGTLEIAPGAGAALEPGGWHLMLFDPARILKAGDVVQLTLTCGKDERAFPFTVKAPAP